MGFLKKLFKPVKKILGAVFKPIGRLLKKWLMPKVPGKEGLVIQRKGSDVFIPVVYGTREVGAIVVDNNVTDAPGGAENEFFHVLVVFCYGEIDGFTEFFFNGVSENDPRWRKDKNNPNSAKWFTKETRTGAVNQTAVNAVGKLNRFNATTSRYEGLAHAFFTFEQDKDQSVWNGEPEITAIIRGKKCFDPRTNLTQYTENPSLHQLDYIKSPIYGKGLTDGEINIGAFIALANICDINETAIVDTQVCQTVNGVYTCTGSPAEPVTFRRFSNNTIIDTERQIFENMEEIAESYRGFFPDNNGLISVACEKEETPVFHFNSENILSNITSSKPGRNERYNRVIVRFPNIANKYEVDEVCFPDADDVLYEQWLEEDNFLPQELVLTADYCVYKALALQLAEVAAKVSRNAETVNFTASPLAMECDVGDVVTLTEETRGWVNRTFRISDIGYRDDGFVDITGVQHENGVYPWSNVAYSEIVGGSNLGDPTNIPAPTGLFISPDPTFATAGTLTWNAANNAFIRRFEVSVFQGANLVYRTETLGRLWSIPLLAANVYTISVRAVSSIGTLSPAALTAFTLTQPLPPTDIEFNVSNFELEARPVLAGAGLGTQFEFAIGDTNTVRGRGVSIVFAGLQHGTEYTVFARTVNALGVSAWISRITTTTSDGSGIVDLIGEDIAATIFDDVVAQISTDLEQIVQDATSGLPTQSEVQQLIDDSIALVNAADSEDPFVEVENSILAVLDEYGNRVQIRRVDFAIAQEGQLRAAAILQLNAADQAIVTQLAQVETNLAGTNSALSIVQGQVNNSTTGLSATFNLAQQANTTANGNTTSISQIQNQINDPNTGLAATASFAQQVNVTANNALSSATAVTNTVNNPTTGLSATNTLAQQAKTTADGNTSSITTINNTINNPTTGLNATFTLATSANNTANSADSKSNNNATAIASLQTTVTNQEQDLASAQLTLQSTVNALGVVSARAFLGVTTVTAGRAVINGIVVDGATNTLEFRADTLRLTDTGGNVQLYWDAGRGKFVFNGDIVAGTFQTATSGFRAEMSGTGMFPFWYGANAKTLENALFAVDTSGNVVMRNATLQNVIMQGSFLSASGSGNRVEINTDSTYLIWAGNGAKNDANGIFWIKANGTGFIKGDFFTGQIFESKAATQSFTGASLPFQVNAPTHTSIGNTVEVTGTSSGTLVAQGNQSLSPLPLNIQIRRGTTVLTQSGIVVTGVYNSGSNNTTYTFNLFGIGLDTAGLVGGQTYNIVLERLGGPTLLGGSCNLLVRTFEDKRA